MNQKTIIIPSLHKTQNTRNTHQLHNTRRDFAKKLDVSTQIRKNTVFLTILLPSDWKLTIVYLNKLENLFQPFYFTILFPIPKHILPIVFFKSFLSL